MAVLFTDLFTIVSLNLDLVWLVDVLDGLGLIADAHGQLAGAHRLYSGSRGTLFSPGAPGLRQERQDG